jgi:hypothetical protein
MIDASLNEVESVAGKAARGAGLSWGMAEEAAKAARWLAACGLDWSPGLLALLERHSDLAAPMVRQQQPILASPSGASLSPLIVGSYLADLATEGTDRELGSTAHPLWLLPFAARAATESKTAVVVSWGGVSTTVWPYGGEISGDPAALHILQADRVSWIHLRPGTVAAKPTQTLTRAGRSAIAEDSWQALLRLGARTYVPASEISRTKGAGAGMIDND